MSASPGIYAWFGLPSPTRSIDVMQAWQVVPDARVPVGIFAACQMQFEGGSGGYVGLQIERFDKPRRTVHKALFSLWDLPSGVRVEPTDGSHRFGGEGTGVQCLIPFGWKRGRAYRLEVRAGAAPGDSPVAWAANVVDVMTGGRTRIGSIAVPPGYGAIRGGVCWLEYYFGSWEDSKVPRASVTWSLPADTTKVMPNFRGATCATFEDVEKPRLTMSAGRGIAPTWAMGRALWS